MDMNAITVRAECRHCGTVCVSSLMCILITSPTELSVLWFMCPGCLVPIGVRLNAGSSSVLRHSGAAIVDSAMLEQMQSGHLDGPITVGEFNEFIRVLESDDDLIARLQESEM